MEKQILAIWLDLHQELEQFIAYKVKDTGTSKDILQDVFIKIQTNINQLNNPQKLTSWVYQITRHEIINYFRQKKKYESIETVELTFEEEPEYQKLAECINTKIAQLPNEYREAFILTTVEAYSQKKLSEQLGISYSGTKSRVQRAKDKLKTLVSDCENVETNEKGEIIGYEPIIR